MWKEIKGAKQGICPKCKSKEIKYGTVSGQLFSFRGEYIMYPFKCKKCGLEGRENWDLAFSGIYVIEKN